MLEVHNYKQLTLCPDMLALPVTPTPTKQHKRNKQPKMHVRIYNPSIVPPKTRTVLRFWKAELHNLSTASLSSGSRLTPSNVFDVDPLVGGANVAGFAQWAGFYSSYRVLGSRCKVEAMNAGTGIPAELILVPLNQDPTAVPSTSTIIAAKQQPYVKSKMVPMGGGPATSLTCEITTEKIFGSKMVLYDDNFASLTSTGPVNNWYWLYALYTVSANSNNTFHVNITVDIDVEFYDRRFLNPN